LWILFSPNSSTDIETGISWPQRPFPDESYIREIDGVTYYIAKWTQTWFVEWVNVDGHVMDTAFPYRFTADEVLAYVSDLERVEIG